MYGFYLRRDMHGYFHVNQSIHEKIVEAPRNAACLATCANFAGRIRRIRYSANFARKRERWREAMREHEMIPDALRRRAGSELSDILFHHLRNKRTAAIEHLSEVEQAAKPGLAEAADWAEGTESARSRTLLRTGPRAPAPWRWNANGAS